MSQVNNHRGGTLKLIGAACLVLFALFILLSIPLFWEQMRVLRDWPVRQAIVTRSAVATQPSGKHQQLYSVQIEIAYVVDGRPVTTELISFQSGNYDVTARRAAEFPVGSRHAIRYDPSHPQQVRMGAGWNRRFFAMPLITVLCAAIFAILAAALFISARWFAAPHAMAQPSAAS